MGRPHDLRRRLVRAVLIGIGVVRLAVMLAAPEYGTQPLIHALRFLASAIRLEPGCLGCGVWIDDADESTVRYVEEWTTEEAMRQRVRSSPFTRLLEVMESAPQAPSVQFDFVMQTRGLDYVAEVREQDDTL
jgi:quinol monooxygenase YgiN